MRIAEGAAETQQVEAGDLQEILGAPRFENEAAMRRHGPVHRPRGAQRHRHDRRDQPARPGAAHRRPEGESGRRRALGHQAILVPARNRKDLDEIPESARNALEFVWLDDVDGAMETAFTEDKAQAA